MLRTVPFLLLVVQACGAMSPEAVDPFNGPAGQPLPAEHLAPPALTLAGPAWLVPGYASTFVVTGPMAPGELIFFALGLGGVGAGPCPAALGGQCLDIRPVIKVVGRENEAGGSAMLTVTIPPTAPTGVTVGMQSAAMRGPSGSTSVLSNAISLPVRAAVLGCTDPTSVNHDPTATVDDGSCTYGDLCADGLHNGDETDVDCGGGTCDACSSGQQCDVDTDCKSDVCQTGGTCLGLSILVASGYGTTDLIPALQGWGHLVTELPGSALGASFDYSPYDVVSFMYDSSLADPANLLAANVAGTVGILCHRCDGLQSTFDLGASGMWQDGSFAVTDTSHYITSTFGIGPLDLYFTYKSIVNSPSANTRTLGTATAPSLVVHRLYRRVVTPYYGHTTGMPWSPAAEELTARTYDWAAGSGAQDF